MKRALVVALGVAVLAFPAAAVAVPYLSYGEASRQIGKSLHRKYTNVEAGSLETSCWRLAQNRVRCDFEYGDRAGNWYCGRGTVRETARSYYTSWRDWECSL
jgi:nuclear transport factor 2 (NTF2) superfamily protein